jgi:nitroreductase
MEFNQLVMSRRSVYKFQPKALLVDDILPLVESAIMAPNHHLTQPWRFILLGKQTQSQLAHYYGEAKAAKAMAADAKLYERIKQQAIDKFLAVPTILLVVCRLDPHPIIREEDTAATYCAIQNLLLAVTDQGLGAQWSTHPIIYDAQVMAEVGVDITKERCCAMIYMGYPEVIPPTPPRKSARECLTLMP